LCGLFQRLENYCFGAKAHVVVPVEVVMCLARSLVEGLVCLAWGMLFVVVVEGRL
jgi:hypothetical protein